MTTKQRQIRAIQPSTTTANDGTIPSLECCCDVIKGSSCDKNKHTKELAQLFTSCIALLIHLDHDSASIEASSSSSTEREKTIFPHDIPAINSVLGNKELFQALLNMLHSPINSTVNAPINKRSTVNLPQGKSSHHHHHQHHQPVPSLPMHTISRKRSHSHPLENGDTPNKQANKAAKIMLSPKIGSKESTKKVFTTSNNSNSSSSSSSNTNSPIPTLSLPGISSHSSHDKQSPLLKIPFSVLAATIFYSALRHVDQWPAVLVKAYAEDSFGARSWVDDERCNLFTKNLALSLAQDPSSSSDELMNDRSDGDSEGELSRRLTTTTKFVNSFNKFFSDDNGDDETCTPEDPAHRPAHLPTVSINAYRNNLKNTKLRPIGASKPNTAITTPGSRLDIDSTGDGKVVLEVSSGSALKFTTPSVDGQFDDLPSSTTTSTSIIAKNKAVNDSFSSSSGEENTDEITMTQHNGIKSKSVRRNKKHISTSLVTPFQFKHCHWWWLGGPTTKTTSTRLYYPRFIGSNKALAHKMIGEALSNRLSARGVKQNSRFLSTLPSFVSLPEIRKLAAGHLQKWLQSPAVSLLAQSLLSTIVAEMKNVDPPLLEDIDAIDSILSMNLKGNQFNAQKENVTSIVKSVPTAAISRHVISRLLTEELKGIDDKEIQIVPDVSENLEMFRAVHTTLHPTLAYGALADFTLLFLNKVDDNSQSKTNLRVKKLRNLLRRVVDALGSRYDGSLLVKTMLERDWNESHDHCNLQLHDVARIIFECVTLMIPPSQSSVPASSHRGQSKSNRKGIGFRNERIPNNNQSSLQDPQFLSPKLLAARKVILKWCLNNFTTHLNKKKNTNSRTLLKRVPTSNLTEGAGAPDYASVLDGQAKTDTPTSTNQRWILFMRTLRCLLFIEKSDSIELLLFLSPNLQSGIEGDVISDERTYQIRMCCDYGVDVDNEIMRMVFEAASAPLSAIDASSAVSLIEQLFFLCREGQKAVVKIDDCSIIWDLYNLTEYVPQNAVSTNYTHSDTNFDPDNQEDKMQNLKREIIDIPRLAYPGLWWRATMIALTICGKSPQTVGAQLWDKHPTLRALIKMTTAEKYRYPTSECNDQEREATKKNENRLREEESKITEALFFPTHKIRKNKISNDSIITPSGGLRVSARQRAKQEKVKANQRKKERAEALTEDRRRKKLLRTAQKSIMLWDPTSGARKPPKESIDLILSVKSLFDLSNAFKECINPDFLLKTIGSNSRDSIERAYDWLIPVVSSHPNMISRLPPSASCYLLLRVYGVDDDGNHQLLKLSAPLLKHVTQCLTGYFGQQDAQRAADILFFDIADQNPDRRRCARQALHESLGELEHKLDEDNHVIIGKFSWLFSLLHTKHSSDLAASAVPNLSRALVFERGTVLRAYILALHHYSERVPSCESWNFATVLCDLLSTRPHVCRALIDRFADVRNLTIEVVRKEFDKRISTCVEEDSNDIIMFLYVCNQNRYDKSEIKINLPLLRACIVLMSNWRDDDEAMDENDTTTAVSHTFPRDALMSLVNYLIPSSIDGLRKTNTSEAGAASAKFVASGRRGVSVEEWVMLAKSRCDFIAKHSALSAPDVFLPRLLLCCGLPQSSLLSMIERLGQLGDESVNRDKCFGELLSPSATIEWGLGYISKRTFITRKLLGRITADINILCSKECCDASTLETAASSSFVSWLEKECENGEDKLRRTRSRKKNNTLPSKGQNAVSHDLKEASTVSAAFTSIFCGVEDQQNEATIMQMDDFRGDVIPSLSNVDIAITGLETRNIHTFTFDLMHSDVIELDLVIGNVYTSFVMKRISLSREEIRDDLQLILDGATQLLMRYRSLHIRPDIFTRTVLKWVPILSEYCEESFWETLFSKRSSDSNEVKDILDLLVTRCIASWSTLSTSLCQAWILKKVIADELCRYSTSAFLKCLVHKAGQSSSCDAPIIVRDSKKEVNFVAIAQQPEAVAAFRLALDGANCWYQESDEERMGRERNLLPDWMILMLLVGKQGKKHLDLITSKLIDRLPSNNWEGQVIPVTLLRLYSQFPSAMNLNNGKTRQVLVDTSAEMASDWLKWRTPVDERIERMIFNLVNSPNQRQQQLLIDISKRYPLIACRHIFCISDALSKDAAATSCQQDAERRGDTIAQIESSTIKVIIVQWGCEFTEALWGSTLDILMTIPKEVIFVCGNQMGLLELLNLYLKLFVVQGFMERGNPYPALPRIRDKFLNFANNFLSSNRSKCELWLESELQGVLKKYCSVKDAFNICDMELSKNICDEPG